MDINTLLKTLESLIGSKTKVSVDELANALGKERSGLYKRAKRNSHLRPTELEKIEQYFGVSLASPENFIEIPVRGEVSASMGTGITIYNESQTGTYKISSELARDLGISRAKSEMILAAGDSMAPTIEGGDNLLIDCAKKDIYDGKIYCVRIEGQLYAKRLQKIPPHTIKVISDNKEKYDPFYIDFSKALDFDFCVIGEVRWWGRVAR